MKKPAGSLIFAFVLFPPAAGLASSAAPRPLEQNTAASWIPISGNSFRRGLCAFISGYPGRRLLAEVTVDSVLRQMPGVRIAVSAQASEFEDYQE